MSRPVVARFDRLTEAFYRRHVQRDEILGPVFANMPADHPHHVALWLSEVFGGPTEYSEHHGGYAHMVAKHIGLTLTETAARTAAKMKQGRTPPYQPGEQTSTRAQRAASPSHRQLRVFEILACLSIVESAVKALRMALVGKGAGSGVERRA